MNRSILTLFAAALVAAGCQDLNEMGPETTTTKERNVITASIPEKLTKVSMNAPADGKGLELSWEADDALAVIGETTEIFSIAEGFTAHSASFNGTPVNGNSFTVLYPGQDYETLASIKSVSYVNQTQNGNGSTDHLFYHAIIETSDYTSLDFSKARQNGVIRFYFQLPENAGTVNSVTISAGSDIFYTTNDIDGEKTNSLTLNLEGIDVSESEQILTAYMMIPWFDVELAAGSKLDIEVQMPDSKFVQVLTVPETGLTILSGKVNSIGLNNQYWDEPLFFAGSGTEADPYQIKTYAHLDNVRKKINADTKTWFKLVADIDMTDKEWTMYNGSVNNAYKYDFDGGNHTISNFSMERSGASFFGALTGGSKVHDLKFDTVSLKDGENGTNSVGTVSYNIIDGYIDNVDITNITITSNTSNGNNTGTGSIASRLYSGKISNCDVSGLIITGTAERVGGILGINATNGNTIENCTVTNASISGGYALGGIVGRSSSTPAVIIKGCKLLGENTLTGTSSSVGGILGEAGSASTVQNCHVKANINSTSAPSAGDKTVFLGGIIGYPKGTTAITLCTTEGNMNNQNARAVGGIIGGSDQNNSITISKCAYLGGDIISSGRAGGIAGWIKYAITVSDCYSAGRLRFATWSGGIVGWHQGTNSTQGNISNCYSTMNITTEGNGMGGIVGCFDSGSTTRSDDNTGTIINCIAWNSNMSSTGTCSGCITGGSGKASSISNCYRNPAMTTGFTASDPTDNTSTSENAGKPYHGKAASADATVSSIAQTLGWSSDIWDFSTELPTLKNLPE